MRECSLKQKRQGAGRYSKIALSEIAKCYTMALVHGLSLINWKAKDRRMSDEPLMTKSAGNHYDRMSEVDKLVSFHSDYLVAYVQATGDKIKQAYGIHEEERR